MPCAVKATCMFQDQVNIISGWFKSWNGCEQTVALYSLIRKLSQTQAKFLLQVLEQSLKDATELQILDTQANNAVFISNLCNEPKDTAVSELLLRLPLLKPGNIEAKMEYMKIIPKILTHSLDHGMHIEESRQLLSYSLIHPAMNADERMHLSVWLSHLEERFSEDNVHAGELSDLPNSSSSSLIDARNLLNSQSLPFTSTNSQHAFPTMSQGNGWAQDTIGSHRSDTNNGVNNGNGCTLANGIKVKMEPITTSSGAMLGGSGAGHAPLRRDHFLVQATISGPPQFNSQGAHVQGEVSHRPLARSSSVTPPSVSDWLNKCSEPVVPRSQPEIHVPLSPQSSVTSSGSSSDTHQEDGHQPQPRNTFLEEHSGMKDVPAWLKSLRLHKYASLFQQLEYDDMMELNEEWLGAKNVTKGARHKIVLSIGKLRERQNVLRSLEKEIMESGDTKQALCEMRNIIMTPMKMFQPPAQEDKNETLPIGTSPDADSITEGDLPGQYTRVMGKVCTQLLVSSRQDDECFNMYLQLIDKCVAHEAFTAKQKKLLMTWKQSVARIWHPQAQRHPVDKQRKNSWGPAFPLNLQKPHMGPGRPLRGLGNKSGGVQWTFNKRPLTSVSSGSNIPLYHNTAVAPPFISKPALLEVKPPVHRTHSAPIPTPQFTGTNISPRPVSDTVVTEPEINARLDDLCLSMTEAALGGMDNPDRGATF